MFKWLLDLDDRFPLGTPATFTIIGALCMVINGWQLADTIEEKRKLTKNED